MSTTSINRQALVARHNIKLSDSRLVIPLGNGEFCFNTDRTGLQTFGGNTMAHWAWHEFPLPEGITEADLPKTGCYMNQRLTGEGRDLVPPDKNAARSYMIDNPHAFSLSRLRFVNPDGSALDEAILESAGSTYDLWNGVLTSEFVYNGRSVRVTTAVHPDRDAVTVRVETDTQMAVMLDFAYPAINYDAWNGTFDCPERHTTDSLDTQSNCTISRIVDQTNYRVVWKWSSGHLTHPSEHARLLSFCGNTEFTIEYYHDGGDIVPHLTPMFDETLTACTAAWNEFWSTGGAIDLSDSTDERWFELERRIVLSQYILRVQSAGSWPSAEAGLMYLDSWRNHFHMEMVWWHVAHYALWQRMELADRQLGCYRSFLPVAKELASQLGYKGAKWGKSTTPDGRTAPWEGNLALLWKQPHPIFFAELEYLNRPTSETLEKWAEIVEETAVHMADYAVKKDDGFYHLDPVMPPCELGFTRDTLFDLAYWKWAFDMAQIWRERMGKPRVQAWDDVSENLAPLPVQDDLYIRSPEWTETYTKQNFEHPDPVGIYGMIPPTEMVNRRIARNSLQKVWEVWNKNHIWGWDFPWIAMSASRLNRPDIAIEAMLSVDINEIGGNSGGSYPYLPANGAILYAAAMMAVGRNGEQAPGFPMDGKWIVKAENLIGW